jgi:hypothetical protein
MKKIYLIQAKISDHQAFDTRVKSIGTWIKYFDNNWMIESTLSAKEIYDKLSIGFENVNMFIIELNKSNYWGRMNSIVWDYLKNRK